MIGAYLSEMDECSPALTLQFCSFMGRDHSNSRPSLTEPQLDILQSYLDIYVKQNFEGFISAAPAYPLDFRPLHRYILSQAYSMSCEHFATLLAKYYPPASTTDATFTQNCQLREFLLSFNQLCREKADVNITLFSAVFDNRLSPKKNSPTKRRLVADFFKDRMPNHISSQEVLTNYLVQQATLWANTYLVHEEPTPSARRRLFGE